jgi:hypothetical protein
MMVKDCVFRSPFSLMTFSGSAVTDARHLEPVGCPIVSAHVAGAGAGAPLGKVGDVVHLVSGGPVKCRSVHRVSTDSSLWQGGLLRAGGVCSMGKRQDSTVHRGDGNPRLRSPRPIPTSTPSPRLRTTRPDVVVSASVRQRTGAL